MWAKSRGSTEGRPLLWCGECAGTKEGFGEKEPMRIWEAEKEFSGGEAFGGSAVRTQNGGMKQNGVFGCFQGSVMVRTLLGYSRICGLGWG